MDDCYFGYITKLTQENTKQNWVHHKNDWKKTENKIGHITKLTQENKKTEMGTSQN
jgi:ribosomal protein S17E